MPGSVTQSDNMQATLEEILAQLANLSDRVAGLEELASLSGAESPSSAASRLLEPFASSVEPLASPIEQTARPADQTATPVESVALPSPVAAEAGISETEFLAIAAALAAWLGVHAHIRQIRLIRTGAWAQQGRVTIQASHSLNH